MKTFFRIITGLTFLSLGSLLGCGGHASGTHEAKAQEVPACESTSGTIGSTVKCSLAACPQDCTLFFETATGLTFFVDQCPSKADASAPVDIKVPTIPQGEGSLYCCAGECTNNKTVLVDKFSITPPVQPVADCPDGEVLQNGACVIAPSTPPPATSACSFDTDCTAGKHCVQGSCVESGCTTDAQCSSGQVCQNGSCVAPPPPPPPPPPPAPASIVSFTVDRKFDEKLGLVKIHWEIQGNPSEFYIYSNDFNRYPMDWQTVACDDNQGQQRLLVDLHGNNLNPNSQAYNDVVSYLNTTQQCTQSNCHLYDGTPMLQSCMDLKDGNDQFIAKGVS